MEPAFCRTEVRLWRAALPFAFGPLSCCAHRSFSEGGAGSKGHPWRTDTKEQAHPSHPLILSSPHPLITQPPIPLHRLLTSYATIRLRHSSLASPPIPVLLFRPPRPPAPITPPSHPWFFPLLIRHLATSIYLPGPKISGLNPVLIHVPPLPCLRAFAPSREPLLIFPSHPAFPSFPSFLHVPLFPRQSLHPHPTDLRAG